jgi:predicted dehydrogenase
MAKRKINMGMIGGGRGAFIGQVHRMAANLDGHINFVCGALSSDPRKAKLSGKDLYLPNDRNYGSFEEMIQKEQLLPEGVRMDFVSIVTPNHMHFPAAKMALEHGFHVLSDKPATLNLKEAKALQKTVKKTKLVYGLTHNYTGYPMVKEARDMVAKGKIGEVRKVIVEYPQGWMAAAVENTGQKPTGWRTDPKISGATGCIGDIGTHAENLAEYITGLKIKELCADLTVFLKGHKLDDDGNILLRFNNGAKGVLHASQICIGEENPFNIRIYGSKAGLEWHQMRPNHLLVKWPDRPSENIRAGSNHANLSATARAACRIPGGHPEAFIEAFANIYVNYARTLQAVIDGKKPKKEHLDFPTIDDGVRGMSFIDTVVKSSKSNQKWTKFIS